MILTEHEHYMDAALDEARAALAAGEFPVGCVFVAGGAIVARGHREHSGEGCRNEIDHAEVLTLHRLLALRPAIDPGAVTVYSTMEPCLMCYSTLLLSGVRRFVWAYEDVMGGGTNLPLSMLNPLYRGMEVHLLDQVRRAEHGKALDLAAIEQLAGDQQRFDGLADANVISDQ